MPKSKTYNQTTYLHTCTVKSRKFEVHPLTHSSKTDFSRSDNKSKKGGIDQESIQSSATPDPGYHMGK